MQKIIVALLFVTATAMSGQDKLQPLNVKTGLWEVTRSMAMTGELPISPEMMARLTPEQRARLEKQAGSAAHSNTTTYKSCVTKEQLEKQPLSGGEMAKNCTQKILASTSSTAKVHIACDMEGMKSEGTIQFEALNPENVKGSGQMTANGGGHSFTNNINFTSKWVGPDCGDVK